MRILRLLSRKREPSNQITKHVDNKNINNIRSLVNKIKDLDGEIKLTTQAILQAQIVRVRSMFFQENNIFNNFQRRIIQAKASTSLQWHQKTLLLLKNDRKTLQAELDKLTGRTWHRRLENLLNMLLVSSALIILILFVMMGLFTALYLVPIFTIFILILSTLRKQ